MSGWRTMWGGTASIASISAVLTAAAAAGPPEEIPRGVIDAGTAVTRAPKVVLHSGDLSVVIALPDANTGFYRGTRFDWSGMIVEVRRGSRRFYGPWFDGIAPNIRDFVDDGRMLIAGPQAAATGPVEEFIGAAQDPVPGYAAAPAGGTFLKIGVGRLRKPDTQPYSRFRSYQIVDGGRWTVRKTAREVTFSQMVVGDAAGYGYRYDKSVRLDADGSLVIAHRLRNIGMKPIATQVYNHNFTRFDDRDVEPGTIVGLPFALPGSTSAPDLASVEGSTVRYRKALVAGDHVTLALRTEPIDASHSGFRITAPDGADVSAMADTPIARAMLWSIRRVVAVEPFVTITCVPGDEQRWTWRYRFSVGGGPVPAVESAPQKR